MAAVLPVQISHKVIAVIGKELPTSHVFFWCDSQIVLHWILGKGSSDAFIRRRVGIIKKLVNGCTWMYCPSKMNPVDVVSRGTTVKELVMPRWPDGPSRLEDKEEWPVAENSSLPREDTSQVKDKGENSEALEIVLQQAASVKSQERLSNIIKLEDYSTLNRLLMVTALVIRFIYNCRATEKKDDSIDSDEKEGAMKRWVKEIQQEHFKEEIKSLQGDKKDMQPIVVRQLKLFIDAEGVLRCRGRMEYTELSNEVKYPIPLPKSGWLTRLVILAAHLIVLHVKVRDTLTELRQKFWIPQGRKVMRSNIRKCVPCMKVDGKPYSGTIPPDLPKYRVTKGLPFQFTCVDFAGPLLIKVVEKNGVRFQKVYICLYTCTVQRAVHLEVVEDQSVPAFLRAFRRFISRRGIPEEIISI